MTTVITYGTFDLFHIGHVNLLRRARALGDRLLVGVSTDEFNARKNKTAHFSYQDRAAIVGACRYVDSIVPETDWGQKVSDIEKHGVDIFVMGDDWAGKFDDLKRHCSVIYLARTPGISSSEIKVAVGAARGM